MSAQGYDLEVEFFLIGRSSSWISLEPRDRKGGQEACAKTLHSAARRV